MVLEYISPALGLEALAERIVKEILDLPSTRSRFAIFAEEMQMLVSIMGSVKKYGEKHASSEAWSSLTRAIKDTIRTCLEIDMLVNKVIHSRALDLQGSFAKRPMKGLRHRLAGNKSAKHLAIKMVENTYYEPPPDYSTTPSAPSYLYSENDTLKKNNEKTGKIAGGAVIAGGLLTSAGITALAFIPGAGPVLAGIAIATGGLTTSAAVPLGTHIIEGGFDGD